MEKFYKELKLAKQKLIKTKLKKYNVKLSIIDDIEEFINMAYNDLEFAEEKYEDAVSARTLVADIIRFDLRNNTISAEDEINRLEEGIKELGIDMPSEVSELKSKLEDVLQGEDDLIRKMNDVLGFKIS